MTAMHTELEPPPPDVDDDDSDPNVTVHVSITESDGTSRTAYIGLASTASDAELAAALMASVRAVAGMRGPGLDAAIARRLR